MKKEQKKMYKVEPIVIKAAVKELEKTGFVINDKISFTFHEPLANIKAIGEYLLGNFNITESVNKVAEFLTDTRGKSLCLLGGVGTGKTLLATKILPILFKMQYNKHFQCFKAVNLAEHLSVAKYNNFVIVDDFGTENDAVEYGNKLAQFSEWIDSLENRKCFSIITTNLSAEQIKQRYGLRTLDRIRGNFKVITFNEKSMR